MRSLSFDGTAAPAGRDTAIKNHLLSSSSSAAANTSSGLFDSVHADAQQQEVLPAPPSAPVPSDYVDPDDTRRTVGMTAFFLVLMVLYIGFCLYYRKVKVRHRVGDDGISVLSGENGDERSITRRQQRIENRAVLDESTDAASRARESAEEQAKLDERRRSIRGALMLRLIVEEEDGDEDEGGGPGGERHRNCQCEHCQYWRWDSKDDAGPHSTRGIIAIREGDDEDADGAVDESTDDVTQATGVVCEEENRHDIEEGRFVKNDDATAEEAASSCSVAATLSSPSTAPSSPLQVAAAATPPISPLRLSLSSPKRYIDDLNCGGRRSYADSLGCGNAPRLSCPSSGSACSGILPGGGSGGGMGLRGAKGGGARGEGADIAVISLPSMVSAYGEECGICLGRFQVGDRAAWRAPPLDENSGDDGGPARGVDRRCVVADEGRDDGSAGGEGRVAADPDPDASPPVEGCIHVFHEECISRWLLVRDGCPVCRRPYLPDEGGEAEDGSDGRPSAE